MLSIGTELNSLHISLQCTPMECKLGWFYTLYSRHSREQVFDNIDILVNIFHQTVKNNVCISFHSTLSKKQKKQNKTKQKKQNKQTNNKKNLFHPQLSSHHTIQKITK